MNHDDTTVPPIPNMSWVTRIDTRGKLDKVKRTQVGGARVPASLTRVGVLKYQQGDGTVRRELRPPQEVFKADSLETLRGAPVTVGHPYSIGGLLDAGSYRSFATGHTENVRQDGNFVVGDLCVQDGKTADAIDRGELAEVSLGYQCRMDMTPGVWNGEPYDAIQRGIRYNHTALLPPGTSRADVGLRLDSNDAVCVEDETTTRAVSRVDMVKKIQLSDPHFVESPTHTDQFIAGLYDGIKIDGVDFGSLCPVTLAQIAAYERNDNRLDADGDDDDDDEGDDDEDRLDMAQLDPVTRAQLAEENAFEEGRKREIKAAIEQQRLRDRRGYGGAA